MDAKTAWSNRIGKDEELEKVVTELLLENLRKVRRDRVTGELIVKLSLREGGVTSKRVITEALVQ